MHLGRRQRKIPVSGERLGRRQGDPAVVDGRETQSDIPTENDGGYPYYTSPLISPCASRILGIGLGYEGLRTWKRAFDSQANRQDSHERLIRHWINDGADYCLAVPAPSNPSVQQVRDACVRKEADGPGMLVVQHEVSDHRRSNEPGKCQEVGNRVDVFVQRWVFGARRLRLFRCD